MSALMALHYAFGEYVFHPDVALLREPAFWKDLLPFAFWPLLISILWILIAKGKNTSGILCNASQILVIGDLIWFFTGKNWQSFEYVLPPDFWTWWTFWLPIVAITTNIYLLATWVVSSGKLQNYFFKKENLDGVTDHAWLKWGAVVAIFCAIAVSGVYLAIPRLAVGDLSLRAARQLIIAPPLRGDFDRIIQTTPFKHEKIKHVIDHVQLASVQRKQFYDDLERSLYEDYVLSPIIDATPISEFGWRRTLWEWFYPRIRREHDPVSGAEQIVDILRARVTIDARYRFRLGVETIWILGATDQAGFERIYTAALRSVGIAARLSSNGETEIWTGNKWVRRPRPFDGLLMVPTDQGSALP